MPDPVRRLILANGEQYITPEIHPEQGRAKELPRTYEEARSLVKGQLVSALDKVRRLPIQKRLPDEAIFCLRLHPDMTAKTYDPKHLLDAVPDLINVGSRNYRVPLNEVAKTASIKKQLEKNIRDTTGRMVFIRSNDAGFQRFLRVLELAETQLDARFKNDIRRIELFDSLGANEQLLGFPATWQEGRVELVLHPSRYSTDEQSNFLRQLFPDEASPQRKLNIATYPNGPVFASCRLNKRELNAIAGANPLRAAHPLDLSEIVDLRGSSELSSPQAPSGGTRSTIKVGMFDGGTNPDHPLFKGFVEQDESLSIKTKPDPKYIAHGVAVTGVLLYGSLDVYESTEKLPMPPVSVVSFRAFPLSTPHDPDLYEVIDLIEQAVPIRKDIKVYNLSIGPRGPILDDSISRFTYALDTLAAEHKVTFYVAVGNDGRAGPRLDRIQSPADLVNGVGVGAYTLLDGKPVRAPYSCIGQGREGGKIKPDVAGKGGCEKHPMHLVSINPGKKMFNAGTSFASPNVARLGALASESFDRGTSLLGRGLIVHTAEHPANEPDDLLGHGIVQDTLDDVIRCDEKKVTVVFQGSILPTKWVKLPIMLPPSLSVPGEIQVMWTIVTLPSVNPNHPSDYTGCCVEDHFYPHGHVFTLSKGVGPEKKTRKINIKDEKTAAGELLADGYTTPAFPTSMSGNQYAKQRGSRTGNSHSEANRRAIDCKWEPTKRRYISVNATSLFEPFLLLHAIPRHGTSTRLDFAAVVTISALKFEGDLYDAVRRRYTALQPIRLRTEAELRIKI